MVMIGIDPHKSTHTAVAIDCGEQVLGERMVRASARQVPELLGWAKHLDGGDRIWAVESAGGLGYLLAQQLLAAGESVVDIPATLNRFLDSRLSVSGSRLSASLFHHDRGGSGARQAQGVHRASRAKSPVRS